MKLSEAMLLGSTIKELQPESWECCLLGVSVAATGMSNFGNFESKRRWPWITGKFPVPSIVPGEYGTWNATAIDIISLMTVYICNGKMTLEQAVDWVRSVEPVEEVAVSELKGEKWPILVNHSE